jgi:hypothetical protein
MPFTQPRYVSGLGDLLPHVEQWQIGLLPQGIAAVHLSQDGSPIHHYNLRWTPTPEQ